MTGFTGLTELDNYVNLVNPVEKKDSPLLHLYMAKIDQTSVYFVVYKTKVEVLQLALLKSCFPKGISNLLQKSPRTPRLRVRFN